MGQKEATVCALRGCGELIVHEGRPGRPLKYHSPECKKAARRNGTRPRTGTQRPVSGGTEPPDRTGPRPAAPRPPTSRPAAESGPAQAAAEELAAAAAQLARSEAAGTAWPTGLGGLGEIERLVRAYRLAAISEALRLGRTWEEIGALLGIKPDSARRHYYALIREQTAPDAHPDELPGPEAEGEAPAP